MSRLLAATVSGEIRSIDCEVGGKQSLQDMKITTGTAKAVKEQQGRA
jgi:hypothetical protein